MLCQYNQKKKDNKIEKNKKNKKFINDFIFMKNGICLILN